MAAPASTSTTAATSRRQGSATPAAELASDHTTHVAEPGEYRPNYRHGRAELSKEHRVECRPALIGKPHLKVTEFDITGIVSILQR